MSQLTRLGLLIGCLLVSTAACRGPDVPDSRPATPTLGPATRAAPARITPSPLPSLPTISASPPLTPTLATGAQLTTTRITLHVSPPEGWVNLSTLFAQPPWSEALHERALYLADTKQTGTRLVEAEALGPGALLVAFAAERVLGGIGDPDNPADSLGAFLADMALRGEPLSPIQTLLIGSDVTEVSAVFVDAPRDPLGLFARQETGVRFRLALAYPPQAGSPTMFLMGAREEQWPDYEPVFARALASTHWQREIVVLDERRAARGLLAAGEAVGGQLLANQIDLWTLVGQAGQFLTLSLSPESPGVDLTLTLLAPTGEVLARADFGLPGDPEVILDALLPASGTYAVEVTEFFGEPGRYNLTASILDDPQFAAGGEMAVGEVITGEMAEGTAPAWSFAGVAGQLVSIVLTPHSEQLDLILELVSPDGAVLVTRDETFAGDAEVLVGFELPLTGQYVIHIRSFAGRGGSYALAIDEGGEDTANFFDAGDLAYGNVRREALLADEVQAWFFTGQEGDQVNILVTPLADNLDLDILLLDPTVRRVAQKDEFLSGEPETIELTLLAAGLYTILVREFFGEAGEYEIALTARGDNNLEAGEIRAGETVSGTLPPGKGAIWRFAGSRGQEISLTLTPGDPTGDFVLILQDPTGAEAARVDINLAGEPEQLRAFRLPMAGDWAIVVREFFDEGGSYSLAFAAAP